MKPVLFVVILVAALFFLFKSVENRIDTPEIVEIEESTQMGAGAGSLRTSRNESVAKTIPAPTVQPTAVQPRAAPPIEQKAATQKFNQVQVTFAVGEHGGIDQMNETDSKPNQVWHLIPQANPTYSSQPEGVVLKVGNNTFEYMDPLISYDLNFFIEEITEKDLKVKINLNRTLRARTTDGQPNYSVSLDERIPFDRTLIIIDALPRRASIEIPDSILSTLYRSQAFLSRASEFVQIIKFENPSNSPQE